MPTTISGTEGVSTTGNIETTAGNIIGTGVCPPGVVLPFAILTPPSGWLRCDGSVITTSGLVQGIDASLLQTLRNLLGTTYGAVFGTLPNLQGQFIRGLTTNLTTTSRDPLSATRVLGNVQSDAFQGHRHGISQNALTGSGASSFTGPGGGALGGATISILDPTTDLSGNGTPRTANETRPVNIALLYCIKY